MSVPMRVIAVLLLLYVGCSNDAGRSHTAARDDAAAGAEACALHGPASDLDPSTGSWQRLVAPHGTAMNGMPLVVDAVLMTCDGILSFAHDPGVGGKVAVRGPTKLLWSRDGREWEPRALPADARVDGAAWTGGTWVAVGGNAIISSGAAANDWHEVFRHTDPFLRVAAGAGKLVAVTQRGVAVSADGEQWHWAQLPAVQALYFDVAFAAGRFVVAGVGAVLSSTDGETWQQATCPTCSAIQTPSGPAEAQIAVQEIHTAGSAFFGFGASGELTSSDGLTFAPFNGEHVPDAAFGRSMLNVTASPLEPPASGGGLHASLDAGASWSSLPLQPEVASADCSTASCIVADTQLLVFTPNR